MGIGRYQAMDGRGPNPLQLLLTGIAGGAVLLVISLVFTAFVKGGFAPKFTVNIETEQVGEGIFEGADVKMDGLRIGQVALVESRGVDEQFVRIAIEPEDARFLADNVRARFASSNTLGMTALELFYTEPRGTPLRDGATIQLPKDSQTVTVTSVIRAVGEQLGKIDTGPAGRIGAVLSFEGSSEGIGRMIATAIELGRMKVGDGDEILVGIDPRPVIREGAAASGDLVRLSHDVLQTFRAQSARINYLTTHSEDVEAIATFVGKVIGDLINIFPQREFVTVVDAVLSLVGPIGKAAGGITSFYHRIPMLLDRIDQSFRANPDGTVSLQVQLLLAQMPYLAGDPAVAAAPPATAPGPGPGLPEIPGLPIPPGLFGNLPGGPR
ncbi:MCE family protein [Nocardia uniformis]|uniref:MCE family protein n=1 Tax=Nocardia uniformis TaxID=53432 RepID=A0A849C0I6_9NOCA|nr:MlaD family protein [Nocardia uniformis]NNH70966.1 MCE family protein [Nocardia uniformis]